MISVSKMTVWYNPEKRLPDEGVLVLLAISEDDTYDPITQVVTGCLQSGSFITFIGIEKGHRRYAPSTLQCRTVEPHAWAFCPEPPGYFSLGSAEYYPIGVFSRADIAVCGKMAGNASKQDSLNLERLSEQFDDEDMTLIASKTNQRITKMNYWDALFMSAKEVVAERWIIPKEWLL